MLALVKSKVISSPLLSVKHIGHLVTVIYLSFVIFSPRGMGTKAFFSIYFSRFLGDSLDGNYPHSSQWDTIFRCNENIYLYIGLGVDYLMYYI